VRLRGRGAWRKFQTVRKSAFSILKDLCPGCTSQQEIQGGLQLCRGQALSAPIQIQRSKVAGFYSCRVHIGAGFYTSILLTVQGCKGARFMQASTDAGIKGI
jgi:hypothetical protein